LFCKRYLLFYKRYLLFSLLHLRYLLFSLLHLRYLSSPSLRGGGALHLGSLWSDSRLAPSGPMASAQDLTEDEEAEAADEDAADEDAADEDAADEDAVDYAAAEDDEAEVEDDENVELVSGGHDLATPEGFLTVVVNTPVIYTVKT